MRGLGVTGALLALGLAGCSEYVERRESLTQTSGEAVARNLLVHTIDPWPIEAFDPRITSSGARMQRVVRKYECGDAGTRGGQASSTTESTTTPTGGGGAITQSTTRDTSGPKTPPVIGCSD
jgi:hypothetical protein